MENYRIKPQEVKAVRWDGTNLEDVRALLGMDAAIRQTANMTTFIIEGFDFDKPVHPLDFIVRFPSGTLEVYHPDEFEAMFEKPDTRTYENGFADGYSSAYAEISCSSCDKPCGNTGDIKPKEQVNHPSHYIAPNGKECIDGMTDCFGPEETAAWLRCSAYKYLWRKGSKGPAETDIRKAQWCIDRHNSMTGTALSIDTVMRAIQRFINE